MSNEPLEREPIDRMRARLEALLKANAAPRCGARSKRTGKPCQAAAMPNGRCKLHGGKSTGPRTPEGLERSRKANWKHGRRSKAAIRYRVQTSLCLSSIWDPNPRLGPALAAIALRGWGGVLVSRSTTRVRCPKNEALSNSTPVTAVTSFESRQVHRSSQSAPWAILRQCADRGRAEPT
jgi:hypothetical protein